MLAQRVLLHPDRDRLVFHCPACDRGHSVQLIEDGEPVRDFNGNTESPTLAPDLTIVTPPEGDRPETTCHFTIADGLITYHADSSHAMAGATVDLPDHD